MHYLKPLQRFNCFYCDYGNGLMHYAMVIVAETEGYWCGIQHAKKEGYLEQKHHEVFLPYGDEKAFREFIRK